jgi:hypothetical protein
MKRLQTDEIGFGALGAILIVVIVVVIGAVGWLVYDNHKNVNDSSNQASYTSAAGTHPTADWQSQCATAIYVCVKYPNTWKVGLLTPNGFTVTSPVGSSTAFVQIGQPANDAGYTEKMYITTQTHLYTSSSIQNKIIGGYTIGEVNNSPSYAVVGAGFGDPAILKVGTVQTVLTDQSFEYLHGNTALIAYAKLLPTSLPTNASSQESSTWLASAAAQTGLEILKSVTTN